MSEPRAKSCRLRTMAAGFSRVPKTSRGASAPGGGEPSLKSEDPRLPVGRSAEGVSPALTRLFSVWNLLAFAAWIVGPFLAAGTARFPRAWLYLAAVFAGSLAQRVWVRRHNPELAHHRSTIGAGTRSWDLGWNLLFWPLMASIAVVAGFDERTGGPSLPIALWPVGLLLYAAAMALSSWAMGTNPHFEGTARIQTERDHRVIESGPYRYVRHPGYAALALWALATPLLYASAWAFVPAAATAAWVVLRTALEDAMLRRELPGYADYASRTRFRLVPGIW